MRVRTIATSVLCLALALPVPADSGEEPVLKYFVEVSVPSLDWAAQLAAEGFDVAGVDRKTSSVGLVVTQEELERLDAKGWPITMRASNASGPALAALSNYTDPQEMSAFLDQVVAAHPNLVRKIVLVNTLFEAQKQYAVHITKDVGVPNERPTFILDAQHHAREVMTPEIARDMIDFLTSQYATNTQVQRWVDNINIYVVPIVNPDGAMHVFTTDNFWRKNRHPACAVDNNRNYPSLWSSCNGSSPSCSSETYRGQAAASEPETEGVMQLTSDVHPFFALSYHSYSELIMYPYGCSDPDERSAFDEVALGLKAILRNDSGLPGQYAAGPVWSTIYLADGNSIDTQYGVYGAYPFTIEVNSSMQFFQPDYATWRNITVVRQRTAWTYFLDKTLDGPQIRVTVTDAQTGLPLPATLGLEEVTFTHGESPRHADAKGHHRLLVHSGATSHVSASYPGYCTQVQQVTVGAGPADVDFSLISPAVPQGVNANGAGDNAIDVSWQAAANADQYRVLRSLTSGGPYTVAGTVPGTQTSFHDTGVSGVATYYYVVRGIQGCESLDSAEASGSTTGICTVGPAFAGVASATNTASSTCTLSVSWPAAASRCGGNVTYSVYRGTTTPFVPGPGSLVASGLIGTSFADHDLLSSDESYAYIVRAVESGNGADDGNVAVTATAPTGPDILGTWTDDAGDTGTAKLTPSPPWSVTSTGGNAGPHAYATGVYPASTCAELRTPLMSLGSGSSILNFASKYDLETGADGGIVEIGIPGEAGFDWSSVPVSYPDMLSYTGNACNLPINVPNSVFSYYNAPPVYPERRFGAKLIGHGGQVVQFRWRFASDASLNGSGWWIDDISITNAIFPGPCATGAAPNPKEASPDGGMTASRTAGTAIELAYLPGCGTLDNAVYWGTGPVVGAPVWTSAACGLGNTGQATFDPGEPAPGTFLYFVIVAQSAAKEGSYGTGAAGERAEAVGLGACDKPQDLTGTCP